MVKLVVMDAFFIYCECGLREKERRDDATVTAAKFPLDLEAFAMFLTLFFPSFKSNIPHSLLSLFSILACYSNLVAQSKLPLFPRTDLNRQHGPKLWHLAQTTA